MRARLTYMPIAGPCRISFSSSVTAVNKKGLKLVHVFCLFLDEVKSGLLFLIIFSKEYYMKASQVFSVFLDLLLTLLFGQM